MFNEEQMKFLLHQPEQGMGYQVAKVRLVSGEEFEHVIILNGELHKWTNALTRQK